MLGYRDQIQRLRTENLELDLKLEEAKRIIQKQEGEVRILSQDLNEESAKCSKYKTEMTIVQCELSEEKGKKVLNFNATFNFKDTIRNFNKIPVAFVNSTSKSSK